MMPSALLGLVCCLSWVGSDSILPDLRSIQPDEKTGMALAVVVDEVGLAFTGQVLPLDALGRIVGKDKPGEQINKVLENLLTALKKTGSPLERLVKINVYAAGPHIVAEVKKEFARRFRGKISPAVCYVVGALPHPEALVAMDAVAALGTKGSGNPRLYLDDLPAPNRGAHVTIMQPGPKVYVAGQAEKGTLAEATRRTMESLLATLKFLDLDKSHILQIKAFLHPMKDVREAEAEIARFFLKDSVPSLVFVEWKSSLPIEIELIASAPPPKEKPADAIDFLTPPGMKASPIYSRVARINYGKTVYVSGLYGLTGKDATGEVEELFATLDNVLKQSGSDFRHLAKATYYVSRDDTSAKLNELRPKYYDPKRPPSASKAMVPGVGVEGRGITLDMIAVVKP